jgi:hypothetical protein
LGQKIIAQGKQNEMKRRPGFTSTKYSFPSPIGWEKVPDARSTFGANEGSPQFRPRQRLNLQLETLPLDGRSAAGKNNPFDWRQLCIGP